MCVLLSINHIEIYQYILLTAIYRFVYTIENQTESKNTVRSLVDVSKYLLIDISSNRCVGNYRRCNRIGKYENNKSIFVYSAI